MWEKNTSPKDYVASDQTGNGERIKKFIEWLQWRPLKDYKHFIRLLDKTKQKDLAEHLTASCKTYTFNK